MKIGSKVKFDYINGNGNLVSTTLSLSNYYLSETKMSDESVKGKLSLELQNKDLFVLKQYGYIFAARCLLMKDIEATDIDIEEVKEQKEDAGKAMLVFALMIILAVIIAVIILPIFIILGMHGKLFLRDLYSKCQKTEYKKFVKIFTIFGIAIYALAILAFILGKVIPNVLLSSSVFSILFFGGLIYSVLSLIVMKKKMFKKDEKLNLIQNIKSGFKKRDKKEEPQEEKVKKEKSKNEASLQSSPVTISSEPQSVNENLDSEVKEEKVNGIQKHLESHNSYYKYLQEEISKEEKNLSEAENEYIKANIQKRLNNYKEELKSVLSEKKVNDYIQYLQEEIKKEEQNLSTEKNEYIRIAINNRLAEYKEELEKTLMEAGKEELIHEEQLQISEPTIEETRPIILEEQPQVVEETEELTEEVQEKSEEPTEELQEKPEEPTEEVQEKPEEPTEEVQSNKNLKREKTKKKEKLDKSKKRKKKFNIVLVIFILLLVLGVVGYYGIYRGLFFKQSIEEPEQSTELQNGDTVVKDSITYRLDINGGEKGFTLISVNINEIDEEVVIPSSINGISVIGISKDVFKACNNLRSITIPFVGETKGGTENTHFGYIFGATTYSDNNKFVPKSLKEVIISDGTNIGKFAFNECDNLERVTISESINSIGAYSFTNCTNLKEVKFNENSKLTNIGIGAFSNCLSLVEVIFGEESKLENIENRAFYNCEKLESIVLPDGVISIEESTFAKCDNLKSIILPNSIEGIGVMAFSGCTNLESIEIPNSVTSIAKGVFSGCTSLESITIPFVGNTLNGTSNTHIGYIFGATSYLDNTTYVPASLRKVIITGGTSIESYAFVDCVNLEEITISKNVKNIGSSAFSKCTGLEKVYYNGTIKDWCSIKFINTGSNPMVYAESFYMLDENNEWYEVTEIEIPDTVTSIGNYQFYGFDNLIKIAIPNSVISMGDYVFYKSNDALKIYCEANEAPSGWRKYWNTGHNVIWGDNGN